MADTWKVTRERNGRTSVVFEGPERDARRYISDNYPRVHVEPGSADEPVPDALLVGPNGDEEVFYGTGYYDESGDFEDGFGPVDRTADDEEKPAKKTAKKSSAPAFKE